MLTISFNGRQGEIAPDRFMSALASIARDMPGRRRWSGQRLLFEDLASNWLYLAHSLPEATWDEAARTKVEEAKQFLQDREAQRQAKVAAIPESEVFGFKTKPFEHQRRVFHLSKDQPYFALFMEQGTGKSKVLLDTAAYLWSLGEIDTLLILAPNGVHRQWIEEQVPAHLPDWVPRRALYLATSMPQGRLKEMASVLAWTEGLSIFALNIEALSHKSGEKLAQRVVYSGRVLMAIDESRRIGSPSASRTRAAVRLGKSAAYRRILTGTPIAKGVEDLFSQLLFLSPDVLGYSTFYAFKNTFCRMGGYEGRQIVGYRNLDRLQEAIDPYSFHIRKADCLDLPDKLYTTREVPLSAEQRRLYRDMKESLLAEMQSGQIIEAPTMTVALMRLQQITCGHLGSTIERDGRLVNLWSPIDEGRCPRILATMDLIEEAQGSIIVWCRFRADIAMLAAEMKRRLIPFVEYHGGVANQDRADRVAAFMAGKARVFLGQVDAGGTGLNLQKATTVIYYSNSFNAESRWQSEDRAHRIGQTEKVTYVDLKAPGTLDGRIIRLLQAKKTIAALPFQELKAMLTATEDME